MKSKNSKIKTKNQKKRTNIYTKEISADSEEKYVKAKYNKNSKKCIKSLFCFYRSLSSRRAAARFFLLLLAIFCNEVIGNVKATQCLFSFFPFSLLALGTKKFKK